MVLTRPKRVIKTHWHPNFRNPETLPDIKVVRTSLLLNTIAIAAGILWSVECLVTMSTPDSL